jgi:hypothetical protein
MDRSKQDCAQRRLEKRKGPLDDGPSLGSRTGFASSADAVSAADYTMGFPPGILQHRCPRFVTWLRCRGCQRGYFTAGTPGPQACLACTGSRLQPVGRWDLRNEAAPPGMLRHGET